MSFVTDKKYALACYTNHSALQLLGLSKQTSTINNAGKPVVEYMSFEPMSSVVSELMPSVKRLTSMLVYSDIVELSLVGDSQSALLGYVGGSKSTWTYSFLEN